MKKDVLQKPTAYVLESRRFFPNTHGLLCQSEFSWSKLRELGRDGDDFLF